MAEVQKEVFPNGLKLVTEAMPAVRSVSVGIWLRVGSRNEREVENGITHFLEHMVFKGTKHRSAEDIARAADSIGGHLDAFTAKEFTSFSIKALDEHVPDLVAKEFGDLAARPGRPPGQPPVPSPSIKVRRKKELEQAHICLGAPGYPQAHPKRYACAVMNAVLGGGMSSRLFQNIREKRGLAYAVRSGDSAFRRAAALTI